MNFLTLIQPHHARLVVRGDLGNQHLEALRTQLTNFAEPKYDSIVIDLRLATNISFLAIAALIAFESKHANRCQVRGVDNLSGVAFDMLEPLFGTNAITKQLNGC